jgi:pSer/pThr/pTyr-binding forkhead associated (FHA) protein
LLLIGRGKACDIRLHDRRTSRVHCRVHAGNDRVRI